MFLIRCSILNDVNADIEESQYYIYITQDFKSSNLLHSMKKKGFPTGAMLTEYMMIMINRTTSISKFDGRLNQ